MKQIETSQARAVVGGGFFKSLFKISTGFGVGSSTLLDPVAMTVASAVVTTKSAIRQVQR